MPVVCSKIRARARAAAVERGKLRSGVRFPVSTGGLRCRPVMVFACLEVAAHLRNINGALAVGAGAVGCCRGRALPDVAVAAGPVRKTCRGR
jgi:hypothetical protein